MAGLATAAALVSCAGCGDEDPRTAVLEARRQFEKITVLGSAPDREGGRLLVQVVLEKKGRRDLSTLTVRVEQKNERGGTLRVDHVPLDVADFRAYEGREMAFRVPLADQPVRQLAIEVEPEPDPRAVYPELQGLP